jgi:hypothetical protein
MRRLLTNGIRRTTPVKQKSNKFNGCLEPRHYLLYIRGLIWVSVVLVFHHSLRHLLRRVPFRMRMVLLVRDTQYLLLFVWPIPQIGLELGTALIEG